MRAVAEERARAASLRTKSTTLAQQSQYIPSAAARSSSVMTPSLNPLLASSGGVMPARLLAS
eukprot:scaffold4990_cov387-Prasinococcus_capsulatus_cf.AAC.27